MRGGREEGSGYGAGGGKKDGSNLHCRGNVKWRKGLAGRVLWDGERMFISGEKLDG